ncbi:MAG: metal ABC transporter permease [Planctomycetia bacterium]|nr:metal ABC transporter permease [Planctomycetia bacterium]
MISDILFLPEFAFLRMAFLLSAIASVTFGLIGTFVVVRRIGYMAGALSHCAFGGVGIGLWFIQSLIVGSCGLRLLIPNDELRNKLAARLDPVLFAVMTAVLCSLLIGWIRRKAGEREDTLIGILWSVGMAIGLLFLDRTAGYVAVTGYLFGDILLISHTDLIITTALSATVLLLTCLFFHPLEAICFDEEYARLRNIPVDVYNQLLLVLIAMSVVLMLRIVGMVLVIAMLTIPAATAARFTRRLGPMIVLAILFCFAASWIGILLSYLLNFSSGPMIIMTTALFYVLSSVRIRRRRPR